jgi:hypothetical protein
MVSSDNCIKRFGEPNKAMESAHLTLWEVPQYIKDSIPTIPRKIYCNKQMVLPLEIAFLNIIDRGLTDQVKTWDGCFNIRAKRGLSSWSLHSWAIAIDINAATNGLGKEPTMSKELVACFTDAGFDWGGTWKRKDGMHFQLSYLTK